MNDYIKPGQVWLDTDGKRIEAHGGSVLFWEGTYYWYGENKSRTDGISKIWTYGISCYSSKDLYHWKNEGFIIPPSDDLGHPMHPYNFIDRPHIVYNEKTKKFVCWIKIMRNNGETQSYTIFTADDILGPYTLYQSGLRPFDMDGGDFDLVIAPDKKAYMYFEKVHSEMICADLNEEYTGFTGNYSVHFPSTTPPFVREAPAHFTKDNKQYLFTSGTTGYYPNPTEIAVGDSYHGPFAVLGSPHVNDESSTSFFSQISCVFKVEGKKNLYIAMADRWLPESMHLRYEDVAQVYLLSALGKRDEAKAKMEAFGFPKYENISRATYVWLPIVFEENVPRIFWQDQWRIEDFE